MKKLLDKLRGKPNEYKIAVSFWLTVLAGVVLVPIWLWNASQTGFHAEGENNSQVLAQTDDNPEDASRREDLFEKLNSLGNPLDEVDNELQEKYSTPVEVTGVKTDEGMLNVSLKITNSTFADLVVPTSTVTLHSIRDTGSEIALERVENADSGQFVPLTPAGQTRQAVLFFPRVLNGDYELRFSGLRYQEEGQGDFEQVLDIKVIDSLKPRS